MSTYLAAWLSTRYSQRSNPTPSPQPLRFFTLTDIPAFWNLTPVIVNRFHFLVTPSINPVPPRPSLTETTSHLPTLSLRNLSPPLFKLINFSQPSLAHCYPLSHLPNQLLSLEHRSHAVVIHITIYSPTLALRNLSPILESLPIALATSDTSAPVDSHTADMALMLEIRCARKALAACKNGGEQFNTIQA